MSFDAEAHLKELEKLYKQIHEEDLPPGNKGEEDAALVLESLKALIMLMIKNNIDMTVIELSLFYHWLRLITLTTDCKEADFNRWSSNLESVMIPVVERLKLMAIEIQDDGPTVEMIELGSRVEEIKDHVHNIRSVSKLDDPTHHVEAMNRGLHGLVSVLMTKYGVNPMLIQNTIFYYWLRTTTINSNVNEKMFQKWERNWEVVIVGINDFFNVWALKN